MDKNDVKIDECELGHKFAKLPSHPTKDGRAQCPNCMAIGLERCRQELRTFKKHMEEE